MKYPPVHYHQYLHLDALLNSQKPKSDEHGKPAHEEMLFIIVHQTYELWFKQIITELKSIVKIFSQNPVPEKEMGVAVRRLHRIISIQRLINGQIDVLETMTPLEFLEFRDFLYPASGFQSFQWRIVETMLGLKIEDRLKYNDSPFYKSLSSDQQKEMLDLLSQPSLLDLVDSWLARTPFLKAQQFDFWKEYKKAVTQMFQEDEATVQTNPQLSEDQRAKTLQMVRGSQKTFDALFDEKAYETLRAQGHFRLSYQGLHAALLIQLYRDQPLFQLPFELLQSLLDIDELMTQWRYRHALMAHRMLGQKIGTGGTSGHDYLRSATEKHKIFTDFFNLSTFFIPASKIPALPAELVRKMGYQIS
jgi:tryptophan 2,3-dioxygenase